MEVVVFGTGYVGLALVAELVRRGHVVTAASRSGRTALPAGVARAVGDVQDRDFVASLAEGADVIVSALPSRTGGPTLADNLAVLVAAAQSSGARLAVVGGASTVPVREGEPAEGDRPEFPERFAPLHRAHLAARAVLDASDSKVDWLSFVPAGQFGSYNPGTRTGAYRTSTTAQVLDADGRSFIGAEDYALAFVDELEHPAVHRGWITVGY